MLKKPLLIFLVGVVVMTGLLTLIPLNIFDGEVHYNNGIQDWTQPIKLHLSYLFGIFKEGELKDVVEFHLTKSGYALLFILLIGVPGLIAYRFYLKARGKSREK